MKKEECNTEKCKSSKGKKKKIAIGAAIAGTAALIGAGAVIKAKKNSRDKQAK